MSVNLGLLFLLLSGVFTFGWLTGSALGYRNGQHDAAALARLQAVVQPVDLDLAAYEDVVPVAADRVPERRPEPRRPESRRPESRGPEGRRPAPRTPGLPEIVPERGVASQGRLLETV